MRSFHTSKPFQGTWEDSFLRVKKPFLALPRLPRMRTNTHPSLGAVEFGYGGTQAWVGSGLAIFGRQPAV